MEKPRVILRNCREYDTSAISGIIKESIADLNIRIAGKIFIKPNVVTANRKYIHHSYTNPKIVEGMIRVLKEQGLQDIIVGESGGYGVPSRLFLKESGYFDLAERAGFTLVDLNEHPFVRVPLKKGVYHKEIMLSKFIKDADFKIWMPKLKYHIFASITNTLKLNIGILYHKERMLYHDHRIHDKIVDLLEAGYPNLIVSDAIDITYGYESAPYPVRLGALIISDNPLAADVAASYIMGYNPGKVKHLTIAAKRGYGSLKLEDIQLSGDADIEDLKKRPKGKTRLFQVLNELDTPINFYAGCAPDTDLICDGGCEGAVKGCLGTIEKRSPGSLKRARKGAIVTGIYKGDVIMPDGPVLLIGTCTKVEGRLEAKKIYRIKGCPMGTKNLLIKIPMIFRMPSPMLDKKDAVLFITNSVGKGLNILKNRILSVR
ncbi:MAG: DUF362 domain-containing protein [Proteobacteria bacterium]|nr:DUF362 domain-containing protein [Pseudomonadota bacterium]MBU1712619.1 DUF362 domain-containing protein [Pseudomonadota bacterium]